VVFVARLGAAGSVAHHPYHWMIWYGRLQNYPQNPFWAEAGTILGSAHPPVAVAGGGKEWLQHRLADQSGFRHKIKACCHSVVPVAAVAAAVVVAADAAAAAAADSFLLS